MVTYGLCFFNKEEVKYYFVQNGFDIDLIEKFFKRENEGLAQQLDKKIHSMQDGVAMGAFYKMLKKSLEEAEK